MERNMKNEFDSGVAGVNRDSAMYGYHYNVEVYLRLFEVSADTLIIRNLGPT